MSDNNTYSIKTIKDYYSDDRMHADRLVSLWVYYVTRPISFYVTWFFLNLNISANTASIISLVLGLLSCLLFSTGVYELAVTAAFLYNGFLVLDSVDGNISRTLGTSSKHGEFLDALVGDIVGVLILPSIALGIYSQHIYISSLSDVLFVRLEDIILVTSLVGALSYQSVILMFQRKKLIIPAESNSKVIPLSVLVFRNLIGFSFIAPAVIVCSLSDTLWVVVVYTAFINCLLLIGSICYGFYVSLRKT